jgi:hypothetical protein
LAAGALIGGVAGTAGEAVDPPGTDTNEEPDEHD